jgi:hypothetical protein
MPSLTGVDVLTYHTSRWLKGQTGLKMLTRLARVNGHLKVYQLWESKSVPPDVVERCYAGTVDTISPPSLEYVLLKP